MVSKKPLLGAVPNGDDSTEDVSGVVAGESMKLLDEREESVSVPVLIDRSEGDRLRPSMSGAVRA